MALGPVSGSRPPPPSLGPGCRGLIPLRSVRTLLSGPHDHLCLSLRPFYVPPLLPRVYKIFGSLAVVVTKTPTSVCDLWSNAPGPLFLELGLIGSSGPLLPSHNTRSLTGTPIGPALILWVEMGNEYRTGTSQ